MENVNELMNEIKEQCGDCEAWSGTDCTRNPYTQGCLKDENQVIECHGMLKGCDMVQQAVKDTAKEICLKIIKDQPQPIKEKWVEWFKKEYGVEVE